MAKRHPNDRNAVALLKAQRAAQKDEWVSDNGRVIKLKKADLMFIQLATASVEMPEPPTYTVKIGKQEKEYPLDADVIDQTDDPVEKVQLQRKWLTYQEKLGAAYSELAKRTSGAVIFEGTIPDPEMIEGDRNWFRRMKVTGWRLPSDADELWVLYLQTSLTDREIAGLSEAVARYAGGASEELIGLAEATFSGDVPAHERSGDVADAGAD